MFQETLLFNRSIAQNLRVGKPDASEQELREAAARAQALQFIDANPEGFQARIGERGGSFPGGERRRLAIARALLKDPPIPILQDDKRARCNRKALSLALDEVIAGRTTLSFAWLATIRDASRILVFRNGSIARVARLTSCNAAAAPLPTGAGAIRDGGWVRVGQFSSGHCR